ncbi:hypothetical protein ACPA9J_20755 [Pseudomonas aeruginosa]
MSSGLLLFDCDLAERGAGGETSSSKQIRYTGAFLGKGGLYDVGASIVSPPLPPPRAAPAKTDGASHVACLRGFKRAVFHPVVPYQFGHEEVERQHRDIPPP